EKRPLMDVDNVAAAHVTAVVPAVLHDCSRTVAQLLHNDIRVVEVAGLRSTRKENRPAAWQHLGPPLRDLVVLQLDERLVLAPGGRHALQAEIESVWRQHNRIVVAPCAASTVGSIAEAGGRRSGNRKL